MVSTAVLITHEHFDHLDLPLLGVILERSPTARVVLPEAIVPLVEQLVPEDQVVAVNPHDRVDVGGLSVDVVPAFHGVTMEDAYGDGSAVGGRPRFVGYVLDAEPRIYHAGDTIVTDELTAALAPLRVDVALLPINGRDPERESRGIVGNMDAAEAVGARARSRGVAARPVPLGRVSWEHGAAGHGRRRRSRKAPRRRTGALRDVRALGAALRAPLAPAGDTADVCRGVGDERLRRCLRPVLVPRGDVVDDRLVQGERPPA